MPRRKRVEGELVEATPINLAYSFKRILESIGVNAKYQRTPFTNESVLWCQLDVDGKATAYRLETVEDFQRVLTLLYS